MRKLSFKLTERQYELALTALQEWSFIEAQTITGRKISRALERLSLSLQKQAKGVDSKSVKGSLK